MLRILPRRRGFSLLAAFVLFGAVLPAACDQSPTIQGDDVAPCDPTLELCGGDSCSKNEDCREGRFCSSKNTCADRCVGCGSSCVGAACPAGQFCSSSKTCEQECTPGEAGGPCGKSGSGLGYLCSFDGRCTDTVKIDPPEDDIDAVGGSPGTGGMGHFGGMGGGCIDVEVDFTPVIPNVVLVIDQSLSMTAGEGFGALVQQEITAGTYTPWGCPENAGDPPDSPDQADADWRWNVVRNVLFNPTNGIVKPLEDSVRFGMALYSSRNGSVPPFGGGEPAECPILTEVPIIEMDTDFGNYDEMLAQMQCSSLIVDTPTRESLAKVADQFAATELEGPKIIVLATDGLPDSCTCPGYGLDGVTPPQACRDLVGNQNTPQEDREVNWVERGDPPVRMPPSKAEQYDVVQEAKRVYESLGIVVHVVDVSTPNDPTLRQHLTDVATAGHGEIFDGTRPSGLIDAFQTIVDGVRSCLIDLNGEILDEKQDEGTVTLDGAPVTYLPDGIGDGWKLIGKTQIELVGAPCDLIKSGKHDIDIDFPCDVFIPDPEPIPE
jgi:hypothetical protein